MDDGPEKDAILAARAARNVAAADTSQTEQHLEFKLILRWLSDQARIEEGVLVVDKPQFPSKEEDYKPFHIHLDAERFQKAKGLKNKARRTAKTEAEAEEIDATPASVHYNLASQEIGRAKKGLNPFLPLGEQKKEHYA
jgi:hypothetical protein